ncbi:MAG: DUF5107 domain-containing protein [Chloroflexota bacterium]
MRRVYLTIGLLLGLFWLLILTAQTFLFSTSATDTLKPEAYLPLIEKAATPTMTPTPTATPTATAVSPQQPWIITHTLTHNAYQYDHPDCLRPTNPGDFVYPYPRLNHDCVFQKPKVQRTFQAISLHNRYISATVLPELGGRLYQFTDKMTGRQLLYNNPVLKPTVWGHRGWWLASGGIEWAFPTDEHGLNEYRPWQSMITSTANSVSLTVSDVESQTGVEVGFTLTLDADHSYLTIHPWLQNDTPQTHNIQYWLNAMIALDNNTSTGQTEFLVPAETVIIHSTGDEQLPGEHGVMSWPVYNGRSLNMYQNWDEWIGFFAPELQAGYTGIYDHNWRHGLLRIVDPAVISGHKFFGPGTLPPSLWTDDNSEYVEMWSSGVTTDFWTYTPLPTGQRQEWTELWYPASGLAGIRTANEHGALWLTETWEGVTMEVGVTAVTPGTIQLFANGALAASWPVQLSPGTAWHMLWQQEPGAAAPWELRLLDSSDAILLTTTWPPP